MIEQTNVLRRAVGTGTTTIKSAVQKNTLEDGKPLLTDADIEEHNFNFFTPAKVSFREGVRFAEKYYGIR